MQHNFNDLAAFRASTIAAGVEVVAVRDRSMFTNLSPDESGDPATKDDLSLAGDLHRWVTEHQGPDNPGEMEVKVQDISHASSSPPSPWLSLEAVSGWVDDYRRNNQPTPVFQGPGFTFSPQFGQES